MSGSSTKVRVTGHPERYPWMANLVGEVGRPVSRRVNERCVAVLVGGPPCGPRGSAPATSKRSRPKRREVEAGDRRRPPDGGGLDHLRGERVQDAPGAATGGRWRGGGFRSHKRARAVEVLCQEMATAGVPLPEAIKRAHRRVAAEGEPYGLKEMRVMAREIEGNDSSEEDRRKSG